MSDRYYTEWDRWFAEEHDGSPCLWLICECFLPGESEPDHISLCSTTPNGHKTGPEIHKVLHRFTATSYLEAIQKRNDLLGWGEYHPHPDWDVEKKEWKK